MQHQVILSRWILGVHKVIRFASVKEAMFVAISESRRGDSAKQRIIINGAVIADTSRILEASRKLHQFRFHLR